MCFKVLVGGHGHGPGVTAQKVISSLDTAAMAEFLP